MRRYSVEGCTQITGNPYYIFKQDGTSDQDSKRMQDWLENLTEEWKEEVCPPSSPDCNPFDHFVWGVFELQVIAKFRNKYNDLIQKMKEMMGSLGSDTLAKACTSFRSRIEAVFTDDGSFIEYVDFQYVSLVIFFYFNKIPLKRKKKKFRIYRCHSVLEKQSQVINCNTKVKTRIDFLLLTSSST